MRQVAVSGDAKQKQAIHAALLEGSMYLHESWADFTIWAADSRDQELQDTARFGMVGQQHLFEQLTRHAQGGTKADTLRLLACFQAVQLDAGRGRYSQSVEGLYLAVAQTYTDAGFAEAFFPWLERLRTGG